MIKNAPAGIVAQQFTHNDMANAKVGDVVGLVGSMEVASKSFTGAPIGRIVTISDDRTSYVVVELFASMILEQTADGTGVTAGDFLKTTAASANTVSKCVQTAGAFADTDLPLIWGRALNTAAAAATVYVLPIQ